MARPWISTNLAVSADGKISDVHHRPATWTSDEDHQRLLKLRASADALLVGKGTFVADNMTMTAPNASKPPLRCIVSTKGEIPADHPIFSREGGDIHLLVTQSNPSPLPQVTIHHQSLREFLQTLHDSLQVKRLHCEGGGSLIKALAALDVIDEFHITLCGHTLFGGMQSPTPTGIPSEYLPASRNFQIYDFEPHPERGECFLTYRRKSTQIG